MPSSLGLSDIDGGAFLERKQGDGPGSFLEKLIENKAGMYTEKTDILDMFFMPEGTGEVFDLSSGLPIRLPFAFGGAEVK